MDMRLVACLLYLPMALGERGFLTVCAVKMVNNPQTDGGLAGDPDLYVSVKLLGSNNYEWKSKTIQNSRNPEWDDCYYWQTQDRETHVHIRVYDDDDFDDPELCYHSIHLAEMTDPHVTFAPHSDCGELHMYVVFDNPSQRGNLDACELTELTMFGGAGESLVISNYRNASGEGVMNVSTGIDEVHVLTQLQDSHQRVTMYSNTLSHSVFNHPQINRNFSVPMSTSVFVFRVHSEHEDCNPVVYSVYVNRHADDGQCRLPTDPCSIANLHIQGADGEELQLTNYNDSASHVQLNVTSSEVQVVVHASYHTQQTVTLYTNSLTRPMDRRLFNFSLLVASGVNVFVFRAHNRQHPLHCVPTMFTVYVHKLRSTNALLSSLDISVGGKAAGMAPTFDPYVFKYMCPVRSFKSAGMVQIDAVPEDREARVAVGMSDSYFSGDTFVTQLSRLHEVNDSMTLVALVLASDGVTQEKYFIELVTTLHQHHTHTTRVWSDAWWIIPLVIICIVVAISCKRHQKSAVPPRSSSSPMYHSGTRAPRNSTHKNNQLHQMPEESAAQWLDRSDAEPNELQGTSTSYSHNYESQTRSTGKSKKESVVSEAPKAASVVSEAPKAASGTHDDEDDML